MSCQCPITEAILINYKRGVFSTSQYVINYFSSKNADFLPSFQHQNNDFGSKVQVFRPFRGANQDTQDRFGPCWPLRWPYCLHRSWSLGKKITIKRETRLEF